MLPPLQVAAGALLSVMEVVEVCAFPKDRSHLADIALQAASKNMKDCEDINRRLQAIQALEKQHGDYHRSEALSRRSKQLKEFVISICVLYMTASTPYRAIEFQVGKINEIKSRSWIGSMFSTTEDAELVVRAFRDIGFILQAYQVKSRTAHAESQD